MKEETKAKASKFWEDAKSGLKTAFDATKKGLTKAGGAIQAYTDLSVVQIEKKKFESKRKKAYEALGELVAKKLSVKGASSLSVEDPEISELLKEISDYGKEIAKREKILKAAEKDGKLPKTDAAKKPSAKKTPAKKRASASKSAEK